MVKGIVKKITRGIATRLSKQITKHKTSTLFFHTNLKTIIEIGIISNKTCLP